MMWRHPAKLIVDHAALCLISVSCLLSCPVLLSAEFLTNHLRLRQLALAACQTLPVLSNILCQNNCHRVGWCWVTGCQLLARFPIIYLSSATTSQDHVKWQGQSWASLVHCVDIQRSSNTAFLSGERTQTVTSGWWQYSPAASQLWVWCRRVL